MEQMHNNPVTMVLLVFSDDPPGSCVWIGGQGAAVVHFTCPPFHMQVAPSISLN